jgi:hypothetical protein
MDHGGFMRTGTGLFFLLFLLTSCSPAITGISGSSLIHNSYPPVSISANTPLELQAYGREFVSLKSDILTLQPLGIFDFAVYSDSRQGPVTRSAHSIVLRLGNENAWVFTKESFKGSNSFSLSNTGFDGMAFTEQLMVVIARDDWFSDMWLASGREVPERWLAKRFSSSPSDDIRFVAEYREPWPACLDEEALRLGLPASSSYDSCLRPFLRRAASAFTIQRQPGDTVLPPSGPTLLTRPDHAPNPTKLAGEVEQNDRRSLRGF